MGRDFAVIFKKRLKEKFPWLKAMEPYKGMRPETLFICTIPWCGHEWSTIPDNLLNKVRYGCPECAKFQQELIWRQDTSKWLKANRPDLVLCGNLFNYDTPANWKCSKEECGHEWTVNFNSIRGAGSGCPKCGIEKNRQARIFPEEDLRKWLKDNRRFIELIEYVSSNKPARFHCLNPECNTRGGKYWETIPEVIRLQNRGHYGCRDCGWRENGLNQSIPEIEIKEWIKENQPSLKMGSGYQNTSSKVDMSCIECGYEWTPVVASIIYRRTGCPCCAGNAPLAEDLFKNRLKQISGGTIELAGKLLSSNTNTLFQCLNKDCLHQWSAKPSRLISSSPTGCPGCTETGFNHRLPAWMYLMERGEELQFGITNDLPGRLGVHQRDGWLKLDSFGACKGQQIFNKEAELKSWLRESIGLEIKGKRENWFKKRLSVNSLAQLFYHASIEGLTDSDIIQELEFKPKRTDLDCDSDAYPKEWDLLPTSKLEAYEKGIRRFFAGKRCRQGHLSPRWVSGSCCECTAIALKKSTKKAKDARAKAIIEANEYRKCPECGEEFLRTPEMREDKIFCTQKCASSESKRNYVLNNPERV